MFSVYKKIHLLSKKWLKDDGDKSKILYVYILKCKPTKQVYVGQTINPTNRSVKHIDSIVSCMLGSPLKGCLSAHKNIAISLRPFYAKSKNRDVHDYVLKNMEFKVVAITCDKESATIMEHYYIHQNTSLGICLNANSLSRSKHKPLVK